MCELDPGQNLKRLLICDVAGVQQNGIQDASCPLNAKTSKTSFEMVKITATADCYLTFEGNWVKVLFLKKDEEGSNNRKKNWKWEIFNNQTKNDAKNLQNIDVKICIFHKVHDYKHVRQVKQIY